MNVVVDPSALVAVVLGEPDAEHFARTLAQTHTVALSAVGLVEASIVVEARQGPDAVRELELLLGVVDAEIVPVDARQADVAVVAWRRFGKGRHPAGLDLGDTFSYALAVTRAEPLLFKGRDFSQTDLPTL